MNIRLRPRAESRQKRRIELHLARFADEGRAWTPPINVARGMPGGAFQALIAIALREADRGFLAGA